MTNSPSVSLLVPCSNASRHLPRLLAAAQNQTSPFQEVICYDDGSSDDTPEIAARLGARVICGGTNRGVAVARNRLLEAARTDFVHYHDADDLLALDFVEVMLAHAAQVPADSLESNVLLCGITTRKIVEVNKHVGDVTAGTSITKDVAQDFCEINTTNDQVAFVLKQFIHLNTALFPTSLLREVGGFCPYLRISEDVDMMIRLAAHGAQFRAFPDQLVTRVINSDSLTKTTQKARHYRYTLHYVNRCFKRLPASYRPMIGEKALFYARYFYWEGLMVDARRALRLAQRCGVQVAHNAPPLHKVLAKLLGTEKLFWLLKRRSALGKRNS